MDVPLSDREAPRTPIRTVGRVTYKTRSSTSNRNNNNRTAGINRTPCGRNPARRRSFSSPPVRGSRPSIIVVNRATRVSRGPRIEIRVRWADNFRTTCATLRPEVIKYIFVKRSPAIPKVTLETSFSTLFAVCVVHKFDSAPTPRIYENVRFSGISRVKRNVFLGHFSGSAGDSRDANNITGLVIIVYSRGTFYSNENTSKTDCAAETRMSFTRLETIVP